MAIPRFAFMTKGVGKAKERLTSFELALRDAQISQFNLVRVSSIFPPGCKLIPIKQGIDKLQPGEIVYCVLSDSSTNEPHRLLASSVGLAIPKDPTKYGYISEHHSFGEVDSKAGYYAEDLAAGMLATILGIEFDPDKSYDEKRDIWKMSKEIVKTMNCTQSAIGDKKGLWTSVVAGVIFIP